MPFRGHVICFRYLREAVEIVSVLEGHRDVARRFGEHDPDLDTDH